MKLLLLNSTSTADENVGDFLSLAATLQPSELTKCLEINHKWKVFTFKKGIRIMRPRVCSSLGA